MTRENVLFELTREHLETGLRGVPVGYCVTSFVDPDRGLSYVGRPIAELVEKSPLEVMYLLYFGEMGTKHQVDCFEKELQQRAFCKQEVLHHITNLPKTGSSMDGFAACLLIAGMFEGVGDWREDCLNLMAKLPQITAAFIRHHAGWGALPASDPSLGYVENFVHLLGGAQHTKAALIQAIRLFLVVSFDHCGGNLSTFVGKAVASGLENMYGSLAAAMTALAGPRHGRANQDCLEFVQDVLAQAGPDASSADIESLIRKKLANQELIFGFGHAVLRIEDPRATVCYRYCQEQFPEHPLVKIALLLREAGTRVLKENPKITNPYPNIDAITGAMLTAAGFSYPEYFTVLFGWARCIGIAIQIVYERMEARGGKGVPIMRPLYLYKSRK